MASERMSEADQAAMLMALQKELVEMNRTHEDEIRNLKKEN